MAFREANVLRMRQERAGRERMNEMREIQEDYKIVQEARDEAAERRDVESFEGNDDHLVELERRWHQLNPPRPPPTSDLGASALRHHEGCVDEAFFFVKHAAFPQFVGDVHENATQNFTAGCSGLGRRFAAACFPPASPELKGAAPRLIKRLSI